MAKYKTVSLKNGNSYSGLVNQGDVQTTIIDNYGETCSVSNKDIVNDKDLKSLLKKIESDMTVGRILVRPSGTESKIRIMVEASQRGVAEKFATDIEKLIKSKS